MVRDTWKVVKVVVWTLIILFLISVIGVLLLNAIK